MTTTFPSRVIINRVDAVPPPNEIKKISNTRGSNQVLYFGQSGKLSISLVCK
ncbi:MAG: hypothetical protein OEM21_02575 [Nitrosopumilus sp.]|nr:hypothetical protein [Nitrosopumilus sp.]